MTGAGVVLLGALNLDTIMMGPTPAYVVQAIAEEVRPGEAGFAPYRETVISDELADRIAHDLPRDRVRTSDGLGGSAYNVARAMAAFERRSRMGYVGVAGRVGDGYPHVDHLRQLGVELEHLRLSDRPAARSLSFTADGDRTLLTSRGVNVEASAYLQERRAALGEYIAGFQIVHVTSYLDGETPGDVASVLDDALSANPSLVVSVDPGYHWTRDVTRAVERLVSRCSLLSGTVAELAQLGGRLGNEPMRRVADRLLGSMRPGTQCIVVARRHDGVLAFGRADDGTQWSAMVPNTAAAPPDQVVDTTGAGDTFVAGLLAMLGSPILPIFAGIQLGGALANEKVRTVGSLSPRAIQAVSNRLLGFFEEDGDLAAPTP